jgi:hypothetical protein
MAKITREESDKRELFVLNAWKQAIPRLPQTEFPSAAMINTLVKQEFGNVMNSGKVYALRTRAIEELRAMGEQIPDPPRRIRPEGWTPPPKVERDPNAPKRGRGRPPGSKNRVKDSSPFMGAAARPSRAPVASVGMPQVVRGVSSNDIPAINHVFDELRNSGVVNLRVEHAGEGFVLINSGP